MKKTIALTFLAFLFTMFLAFQVLAQQQGQHQQQQGKQEMGAQMTEGQKNFYRASALVDQTVKNTHGETLGTIKDVVLSGYHGGPEYLVIQPEGSNKLVPVPMNRAHLQMKQGQVVGEISKEQLQNAPSFAENQWPNFAQKSYEQKINAYYTPGKQKSGNMQQQKGGSMGSGQQQK